MKRPAYARRVASKKGPDFYVTPEWATRALLENEKFSGMILEPCCGDGVMAEVIRLSPPSGYRVVSSDLYNRGYVRGTTRDFFSIKAHYANIITNPPFNIAEEVLTHALLLATSKVALLLPLSFLTSTGRYDRIYRPGAPFRRMVPSRILIFSSRLSIYKASKRGKKNDGVTAYAWFIWDKNSRDKNKLKWIAPHEN